MKEKSMNKTDRLKSRFPETPGQRATHRNRLTIQAVIINMAVLMVILFPGCNGVDRKPAKYEVMAQVSSFSYPRFTDDLNYDGLEHCISQSLTYLHKIPEDRKFVFGADQYDTLHMIKSLEHFLEYIRSNPSPDDIKEFIKADYRVYRSVGRDGRGEVLYTGYYEPHLRGSLFQSEEYPYPIYARPPDLISIDLSLFSDKYKGEKIVGRYTDETVVPYHDREDIESQNALEGKAEVLAWVKDPIDVFFLQIQGSGKVYLDNGEVINVHYHATNGRPYRSIGKLLIDENKITVEEMSMQKIRAYLNMHPEQMDYVFNYNPSYVFFKLEPDGPLGNINVRLTPGRSIALDRRIFPPAALAYINTQKPLIDSTGNITGWSDFSRFALNQDTGGAITGPGRADLFWGNGNYAEIAAGHLKYPGNLYFLILKPDTP
jgi:membrane-bound lytic murein transglycosylase A